MSVIAYVGMGSNLGKSSDLLQEAWTRLQCLDETNGVVLSSPYQSSPVGMESENLFINAVAQIETRLSAIDLLTALHLIEKDLGRRRIPGQKGYQDRSLDLDLLYYGEQCISLPHLHVPHPRRGERLFVLEPLVEIAPQFCDPENQLKAEAMLGNLREKLDSKICAPQEIYKKRW